MSKCVIPEKVEIFSLLGGGSAYAPGLVQAIMEHNQELELKEIRLYDIDRERLEIVGNLCQKMANNIDFAPKITVAANLEEALNGVDVALNSTRPGGLECRKLDETLPLEFDIPGQETVGPGGFFFALRSTPEALKIGKTLKRLSPKALLLNYTNPTNIVTQALVWEGVNVMGLCDQSDEDLEGLAHALGRPANYSFKSIGLNHATWYSDICFGDSEFSTPESKLSPPDEWDADHKLRFEVSAEMSKEQGGGWPNSYLTYYPATGRFTQMWKREGSRAQKIMDKLDFYYDHFKEEAKKDAPQLKHHRGSAGFGDMAARVIKAIKSEKPEEIVLNLPAPNGETPFKEGTVYESNVLVSKKGVVFQAAPEVPEAYGDLLKQLEDYQLLSAKAAVSKNSQEMAQALAANPLVGDFILAEKMLKRAREMYEGRVEALN